MNGAGHRYGMPGALAARPVQAAATPARIVADTEAGRCCSQPVSGSAIMRRARGGGRRLSHAPIHDLESLRQRIAAFVAERDWDQFHNPKNLAMALAVEVAELAEIFQWLSAEQSATLDAPRRRRVEDELADVLVYLVRIADRLDIDLLAVTARKLEDNARKYPAERVRGQARKYDEYD